MNISRNSSKNRKWSTSSSVLEYHESGFNRFEKHSDVPYTPPIAAKEMPSSIYQKHHKITASIAHPKPSEGGYHSSMIRRSMHRNRRYFNLRNAFLLFIAGTLLYIYKISHSKSSFISQRDSINGTKTPPIEKHSTSMLITNGVLNREDPFTLLREMDVVNERSSIVFNQRDLSRADVDAVVYLRHRVDNLLFIVANLCSDTLADIVRSVTVYNNNHLVTLNYEDFISSQCPKSKLKLVNSHDNLGHLAKYTACAETSSHYCLIQDDDYILPPSIIRSMRALRDLDPEGAPITTSTNEGFVQAKWEHCMNAPDYGIHTCGYTLGTGTLMSTEIAHSFVNFMQTQMELSQSGIANADEYFSILANNISPMVVAVPSILDLVQYKSDEANAFTYYEDAIHALLYHLPKPTYTHANGVSDKTTSLLTSVRAIGDDGLVFLTNIELLPLVGARDSWNGQTTFRRWVELRKKELGKARTLESIQSGYGSLLDRNASTNFKSFGAAMAGDYIAFRLPYASALHMATDSTKLFAHVDTEYSTDGLSWTTQGQTLNCHPAKMHDKDGKRLFECSTTLLEGYDYVRFILTNDLEDSIEWSIHEAWMA